MGKQRGPVSLRARLTMIVVVLVAGALVFSGFLATSMLRGYLLGQVDREVTGLLRNPMTADAPFADGPRGPATGPPGQDSGQGGPGLPSDFYVRLSDSSGGEIASSASQFATGSPDLPVLTASEVAARAGEPFTVDSSQAGQRWRVAVAPMPGGSIAVAKDIGEISSITARLAWLLLGVGVVVLGFATAGALLLVRRSLRPLVEVEVAAAAIAAGDLSQRVPAEDPRTEVGQMSAALNSMLGQVEGAFADRERALAAAQASEEQMRAFVADASHELRTPLTAVSGFAELYRHGAVPAEEVPQTFDRIEQEAGRMSALVEDLLLLARLDQRRPLEREPVDLLALASSDVAAARAAHPGRDIAVRALPGDQAPVVIGDTSRLSQVVRNLLTNALRYSDGPVAVEVGIAGASDARAGVLRVVDHGPGIPLDARERVFDRFYRSDAARSRAVGGSGLGLSIVAAIVDAHSGRVEVTDTAGGGATFAVLLPAS